MQHGILLQKKDKEEKKLWYLYTTRAWSFKTQSQSCHCLEILIKFIPLWKLGRWVRKRALHIFIYSYIVVCISITCQSEVQLRSEANVSNLHQKPKWVWERGCKKSWTCVLCLKIEHFWLCYKVFLTVLNWTWLPLPKWSIINLSKKKLLAFLKFLGNF